jgi:hypothetical protein
LPFEYKNGEVSFVLDDLGEYDAVVLEKEAK